MADNTVNEIVERAKANDRSAFDLLYREYNDKLYNYVLKLGVDSYDAEDIVSDTFVEAIEHIGDLKTNAYFSTWLHTIAKNKVYAMRKKQTDHARVSLTFGDDDGQNEGLDIAMAEAAHYNDETVMLPEDYAENGEIKQILADTVNSLSDEQRDVMFLYYYENLSVGQISERVGAPAGTVKSRLSLARKNLLKKIKTLQKGGVTLCAVPITVIFDIAVKESKLNAGAAAVATTATASAGASAGTGAAVSMISGKIGAVIAAGIMIGGGIGAYSLISSRDGNIKTDKSSSEYKRDASSMDIPDSNINWNPDLIRMRNVREDSASEEDVLDVYPDAGTDTESSQAPTSPRQSTARSAQPTQQAITYNEYTDDDTGDNGTDNGTGGGNISNNNDPQSTNQWTVLNNIENIGAVLSSNYIDGKANYVIVKEVRVDQQNGEAEADIESHLSSFSLNYEDVSLDGSGFAITADDSSFANGVYTFHFTSEMFKNSSVSEIESVGIFMSGVSYELPEWERIDKNGIFSSKLNSGFEMQMLFIDDNNCCTIEKNTCDIGFDDIGNRGNEPEYVNKIINGRPNEINPHELLCDWDYKYDFKDISVEAGNSFFEKIDGALYFKNEYGYSLIWVPDKHYNTFKFPKNTHAYGIAQLKRIDCDSVDYNDNSWMLTEDNFKNHFANKKIIK